MVELASAEFGMFDTETVGVKVKAPVELVTLSPTVTPFDTAAVEVASVIAPV